MEFRMLGPVEVADGDRLLPIGGPKPRALLAHLLVKGGAASTREELVDELWGESPPPTVRDSLNVHAGLLRRALGPRLRTVSTGYALDVLDGEVDASRFEAQVAALPRLPEDPGNRASTLAAALGLWRGRVFGGIAVGPTAAAAAARLEELRLHVLEERVEADLALGHHLRVVPELTEALALSPARERLAGQLMLALHRCGRSADALAVYAETCAVLDEQMGVDPGDPLTQLSRAIHRGDPTLDAPSSALLPSSPTRFIGRRNDVTRVGELLHGARLLTLAGVGGAGKTRLALEVARTASASYPDGVHLVNLAVPGAGASVGRQVAAVLGVREQRNVPLGTQIARRLKHRRALLLLDNCDHLIELCAELVGQLLEAAPGLRVLATSREPLGIPGEVVFTVGGLNVPAPGVSTEAAAASDAVLLLVDRATAARPGFSLEASEASIAASLCRRLDGLPLAIELAASRLRHLSLREVAARVEERLDALGGSRSVDARHRTMRASIEWSHDLLDDMEKVVFRRLSAFAGGFGPAGAEAVVGNWAPLTAETDVAGICGRLVDKSMLTAEPGAEGTRYRVLEIVRQFGAERLAAAGESSEARRRHALWYYEFVPDSRAWAGPEQHLWMERLRQEVDNVHAALASCLGEEWEPAQALRIAGAMWWFWYMAGRVGEGRTWLSRVLAATAADPSAARSLAVRGAAALARVTGEFAEATRLGEESLQTCRVVGDQRGVAAALNNLCVTAMMTGDLEAARRYGEEGRDIIVGLGDTQGIATSHNNLGLVTRVAGDYDRAMELFDTALNGYRIREDRRGIAAALSNQAIVSRLQGDADGATGRALEALRLYRELGFDEGQLDCLEALAAVAAGAGDGERALRLLTVTMRAREELGSPLFLPDEAAQVSGALVAARGALDDSAIERVTREAASLSMSEMVDSVLAVR